MTGFRPVLRIAPLITGIAPLVTGMALSVAACSLLDLSGGPGAWESATPGVSEAAPVPHATPQGFVPVTAGRIRLALPPSWIPDTPPHGWSHAAILESRAVVLGRAGVITKVAQAPDARIVAMSSTSSFELTTPGARMGSKRPIQLPGAKSAIRVDYTFPADNEQRSGDFPSRGTDIAILYDRGKGDGSTTAVVVRVYGIATSVTPQVLDRVTGTIEVAP